VLRKGAVQLAAGGECKAADINKATSSTNAETVKDDSNKCDDDDNNNNKHSTTMVVN